MDNLIYYHTKPFDIVFDPFSGNGTTVDSCKDMLRRYYCSDIEIKPGREKDIFKHDIITGLPDMPKPDFVFLDPPYWKQAEGKYIKHESQLGDMELDRFNSSMENLLIQLKDRKVKTISIVIQATQYKNDFIWTDHAIYFNNLISKWYDIEMRYMLPYSSQQYLPQMVEKAKEKNVCLGLFRDLIVWRIK